MQTFSASGAVPVNNLDSTVPPPAEWTGALRHWRRTLLATVALPVFVIWEGSDGWKVNLFFSAYVVVTVVLLSIGFEQLVRRRLRMWRILPALEAVVIFTSIAYAVIGTMGGSASLLPPDPPGTTKMQVLGNLVILSQLVLAYWAFAYVFPYAADDARLRALEADRFRRAAELAQLRANLEPHFLLNTLNAIAGLVSEDPKEARRLLVCLGDLLRDALANDGETEPLSDQIEWLRRYAEILESRHRGFLRFQWNIEEQAQSVRVPRLLLQPLVENAVSHGALRRADGGEVGVRTAMKDSPGGRILICEVQDNGPGFSSESVRPGAKGLALVRSRLESIHPAARLRWEDGHPGTRMIVEIPMEPAK